MQLTEDEFWFFRDCLYKWCRIRLQEQPDETGGKFIRENDDVIIQFLADIDHSDLLQRMVMDEGVY